MKIDHKDKVKTAKVNEKLILEGGKFCLDIAKLIFAGCHLGRCHEAKYRCCLTLLNWSCCRGYICDNRLLSNKKT